MYVYQVWHLLLKLKLASAIILNLKVPYLHILWFEII